MVDEVQRTTEHLESLKSQLGQGKKVSEEAFGQALQAVRQAQSRVNQIGYIDDDLASFRSIAQTHYVEIEIAKAAGDEHHAARAEDRYHRALFDLDSALSEQGLVRGYDQDLDAEDWYEPEHDLSPEDIAVAKEAAQAHHDLMTVPSDSDEFIAALDRWEVASHACQENRISIKQVQYFERSIGHDMGR